MILLTLFAFTFAAYSAHRAHYGDTITKPAWMLTTALAFVVSMSLLWKALGL